MSDVRVRKLQEFIKQEVSQMLMRGLKDPRGKVLKLRHIPTITFDKDTSLDYSMHIESLLNEIKKDEETN